MPSTVAITAIHGEWLFYCCDALLTLTRPCPYLITKLPVRDNTNGHSWTQTLGRFFTSSCLLFSLNLLIRVGPSVSERWRFVTPKARAAYQRNVAISSFLPVNHRDSGRTFSRGLCQSQGPGSPVPPHLQRFPRECGRATWARLFVSAKAYVFPGEMLLKLWNLT